VVDHWSLFTTFIVARSICVLRASTTVSVYCLMHRRRRQTSCNVVCTSRIEPRQVGPRSDSFPVPHFTLVQCSRPNPVQAVHPSVQYKCQHSMAPGYLAEVCKSLSNIDGHRHVASYRRCSSQIVDMRSTRVLLCRTFSLKRSS